MGNDSKVFLLGITGGIGSGKTQVCRILEKKGARIFSADLAAKEILLNNLEVRSQITAVFGTGSYTSDGKPDFGFIARRAFSDRGKLELLNNSIHPLVYEAFENAVLDAGDAGTEILVLEAALLYESGGDKRMDKMCVVEADEEIRINRVVARDGTSSEEVKARISHQLNNKTLRDRADYTISNNGSIEDLEISVDTFFKRLKKQG